MLPHAYHHVTASPPCPSPIAPAPSRLQTSPQTPSAFGFALEKQNLAIKAAQEPSPPVVSPQGGVQGWGDGMGCPDRPALPPAARCPLGHALPNFFLHHLCSLGRRVPAGGWVGGRRRRRRRDRLFCSRTWPGQGSPRGGPGRGGRTAAAP